MNDEVAKIICRAMDGEFQSGCPQYVTLDGASQGEIIGHHFDRHAGSETLRVICSDFTSEVRLALLRHTVGLGHVNRLPVALTQFRHPCLPGWQVLEILK